jgi:hypothetical protein
MSNKLVIIFSLFLLVISCKKSNKTTLLEGYVMDHYSQKVVPNVVLHIVYINPKNPQIGQTSYNSQNWIEDIQVNSEGKFSYETINLSNHKYDLILINDTIISSLVYKVTPYTNNSFTFLTKKLKNLNLHVVQQDTIYNKATFEITHVPFSKSFILDGISNDTILFEKVIPDITYVIRCLFQKSNNEDTVITRSFIITNSDTISSYNITY